MAQNRSTLRATIRQILGEVTPLFWSNDLLNQWVEDSMLDITLKTKCNRKTGYITTVVDIAEYTISDHISDFLVVNGPVRIYDADNSEWRQKMRGTSQDEMDLMYPGWEKDTGSGEPTLYWYDQELDLFWIYQRPSTRYAGSDYLKIRYASKPAATANDNASPDVPDTLYTAITEFVVARGNESRGYHDIAITHWNAYSNAIKSYNSVAKVKPDQDVVMKNYRNVSHSY